MLALLHTHVVRSPDINMKLGTVTYYLPPTVISLFPRPHPQRAQLTECRRPQSQKVHKFIYSESSLNEALIKLAVILCPRLRL